MHIYRNDSPTETGWPGSSRAGGPVQQPNAKAKNNSPAGPPVVVVKKKKGKAVVKHPAPDPKLLEDNTSTLIDAAPLVQSNAKAEDQTTTTTKAEAKRGSRTDASDSDKFRNVWGE